MRLEDVIQLVSQKTGTFINQSILAESLNITRQTVSNRIKNGSLITVSELKKIEDFFNIKVINEEPADSCEIINVDYYTDVFASCGNGNIIFSEEKIKLPIATMLIEGFSKQKK